MSQNVNDECKYIIDPFGHPKIKASSFRMTSANGGRI
jgi:hypothetical protein